MSHIKVIVSGSRGQMGREIVNLVDQNKDIELVGEWHRESTNEIQDISGRVVIIDFSSPEHFIKMLKVCEKYSFPIVSGTTGMNEEEFLIMEAASKKTPLLWSPNMSLGIAFMMEMLKSFAALSDGADFQIEEWHHRHKKDTPSGTALWLQEVLETTLGKTVPEPLSVRGGGIFGVHKVMAMMDEEIISLEHTALNRTVFARGAITAASWLVYQKPGAYSIQDVLFG